MQALRELFTTDVGLLSIGGIAFMLGMAVFFVRYFLSHMKLDAERAAASAKGDAKASLERAKGA